MRLKGEIGIVTAAASGMGRAGALRFAREGAAVGVVDIDQAGVDAVVGEITAAGGQAQGPVGDLSQDDFACAIVRRAASQFGGLDFVWNHVGARSTICCACRSVEILMISNSCSSALDTSAQDKLRA